MNEWKERIKHQFAHKRRKWGALKVSPNKIQLWARELFDRQEQAFRQYSPQLAAAAQTELPPSVYLWNNDTECLIGGNAVVDQGDSNICVAISVCTIAAWQVHQETKQIVNLEPLAIYNFRANAPEEGMTGDDAFDIGIEFGFLERENYAHMQDVEQRVQRMRRQQQQHQQEEEHISQEYRDLVKQIRKEAYVLGKTAAQTSQYVNLHDSPHVFARVGSVHDMKRALAYGNGPMELIVPVNNEQDPQGQIWRSRRVFNNRRYNFQSNKSELGHCMTIIGYDDEKQAFLVRNSWGREWGPMRNGHCWMPYEDIDAGLFWECYVMFIDGKLHLRYLHDMNENKATTTSAGQQHQLIRGEAPFAGSTKNNESSWEWCSLSFC